MVEVATPPRHEHLTPLRRAKFSAELFLGRVRRLATDFGARIYPSGQDAPRLWLQLLGALLDTAENSLVAASAESTDHGAVTAKVTDALDCTNMSYQMLDLLKNADSSSLYYPVVAPMQRWFKALKIECHLIFRAENVINYEIQPITPAFLPLLRADAASLASAISAIRWPILLVTVPTKAVGILPHFSVVAHELGHVLYRALLIQRQMELEGAAPELYAHLKNIHDLKERVFSEVSTSPSYNQDGIRDAIRASLRKHGIEIPETEEAGLNDQIAAVLEKWVEELSSDAVSFYLTGLASFFALSDFFQFGGTDGLPSHSHPPARLRLNVMCRAAIEEGHNFDEVLRENSDGALSSNFNSALIQEPSPDDVYEEVSKRTGNAKLAAVLSELPAFADRISNAIYSSVKTYFEDHYPELVYRPTHFRKDLDEYLDSLLHAIPPIESFEDKAPATFTAILNVGWIAMLCRLDAIRLKVDPDSKLQDGTKGDKVHGLLLKAVELSEVRLLWEDAKKALRDAQN